MEEKYSIFDIMRNGEKIREKFIKNHEEEIKNGTQKYCEYVIKKFIKQFKCESSILFTANEFKCAIEEDVFFDDVRRVCIDSASKEYVLVSISKINKIFETYGIYKVEEYRAYTINSLYIDYSMSKENMLLLLNSNRNAKKKSKSNVKNKKVSK